MPTDIEAEDAPLAQEEPPLDGVAAVIAGTVAPQAAAAGEGAADEPARLDRGYTAP